MHDEACETITKTTISSFPVSNMQVRCALNFSELSEVFCTLECYFNLFFFLKGKEDFLLKAKMLLSLA